MTELFAHDVLRTLIEEIKRAVFLHNLGRDGGYHRQGTGVCVFLLTGRLIPSAYLAQRNNNSKR